MVSLRARRRRRGRHGHRRPRASASTLPRMSHGDSRTRGLARRRRTLPEAGIGQDAQDVAIAHDPDRCGDRRCRPPGTWSARRTSPRPACRCQEFVVMQYIYQIYSAHGKTRADRRRRPRGPVDRADDRATRSARRSPPSSGTSGTRASGRSTPASPTSRVRGWSRRPPAPVLARPRYVAHRRRPGAPARAARGAARPPAAAQRRPPAGVLRRLPAPGGPGRAAGRAGGDAAARLATLRGHPRGHRARGGQRRAPPVLARDRPRRRARAPRRPCSGWPRRGRRSCHLLPCPAS